MTASIPLTMLGQSGCRLAFPGATIYLDPYLSNSVQKLDAPDLVRLKPITLTPEAVTDADWVLITHEHIDHCDPHTLPVLAQASPRCRFVGPPGVIDKLLVWGIAADRLVAAKETWQALTDDIRVIALPAAHPTVVRDAQGNPACVGFVLEYAGRRICLAGDTSVTEEVIAAMRACAPIHTAFLPVNECNFFRARRGIIGNMSVREAFLLAQEVGVKQVVAVHWDMFAANAVFPDEIRLVHEHMKPGFRLLLEPTRIDL